MADESSPTRSRRFRIEVVAIAIPIAIAVGHLALMATTSTTRWKGGGFGMYADPHPNSYRTVWIDGELDGEPTAFSLEPVDRRLSREARRNPETRWALEALDELAEESTNFPELADLNGIRAVLNELWAEPEANPELIGLLPREDVRLKVIEISINETYDSLVTKTVYEIPLAGAD